MSDNAAANHNAGISGWLGGKIIPMLVDNDRAVQNIGNPESFVIKGFPGITLISHQGKQVSSVAWMRAVPRIIMRPCFCEILGTIPVFVDVHPVKIRRTGRTDVGKAKQLGFYEDAAVGGIIKLDKPA